MTGRRPPAALLALVLLAVAGPFLDNYLLYVLSLIGVYVIFALGYNLLMGYAGQFDFGQGAFLGIGAYTTAVLQSSVVHWTRNMLLAQLIKNQTPWIQEYFHGPRARAAAMEATHG